MTTHVFIVDSTTFRLHLEYLFAGTGARNYVVDFNNSPSTKLPGKTENLLARMIADASRIRKGDLIIFYLQQNFEHKIYEGKFYGIFKAKNNWSFLDNNDRRQYLIKQLMKSLTFRTLIEPDNVYPIGVTEWEALDEIKHIKRPHQMLWSLIYRKLKANRGNTMITAYESKKLCQLIRNKNHRRKIYCDKKLLSFDLETQKIICVDKPTKSYAGRTKGIEILPRIEGKIKEGNSFEPHLQAYLVKNIGNRINKTLDISVLSNSTIEWIGNEVSCGVGMQRIDVLLSVIKKHQRIVLPIELKIRSANEQDFAQIQRYIDWIEQYYVPNCSSHIQPILICKKIAQKAKKNGKLTNRYEKIIAALNNFNKVNRNRCCEIKYVEFEMQKNDLVFKEVFY